MSGRCDEPWGSPFLPVKDLQGSGWGSVGTYPGKLRRADIILNALIGYSLRGAPGGTTADLIGWANDHRAPVLSLDLPSGVDATTGDTPGSVIRPERTLTLALPKTGLNDANAGEVILADIGIPAGVYRRMGLDYRNPFDCRFTVPVSPVDGGRGKH